MYVSKVAKPQPDTNPRRITAFAACRRRIICISKHFYVLLALGPIVEGSAILIAREHIRSMFDLPAEIRKVYEEEKQSLKTVINDIYGPSIITEHGRIQACTIEDEVAMSLVCMYGHTVISAPEPNDAISRSSRQILFVCTYGNSQDTSKRVGKNGLFKLGISKIYTGK